MCYKQSYKVCITFFHQRLLHSFLKDKLYTFLELYLLNKNRTSIHLDKLSMLTHKTNINLKYYHHIFRNLCKDILNLIKFDPLYNLTEPNHSSMLSFWKGKLI